MVKLYLDDVRSPPDETWLVARTAEEARDILLAGPVDYASLDHDLGECEECSTSWPARGYEIVTQTCRHRMTGYDLVKWMAETGKWPLHKPTVHSANPAGRAKMIATIDRYWNADGRPA